MGKGRTTYHTGGYTVILACPLCEKVYNNHNIMILHFKASHKNHVLSSKIAAEISHKKSLEVLNSKRRKIGLPPIVGL
jgi:hypothetical protein